LCTACKNASDIIIIPFFKSWLFPFLYTVNNAQTFSLISFHMRKSFFTFSTLNKRFNKLFQVMKTLWFECLSTKGVNCPHINVKCKSESLFVLLSEKSSQFHQHSTCAGPNLIKRLGAYLGA